MSTDTILNLGADQLLAMWDMSFPDGIPTGGKSDDVALRVDLGFTIPEQSVGTYELRKKGISITQTNTQTTTTKQFTVEWRIDQDWNTYGDMIKWFNAVYDPINGTALPNTATRATILCQMLDTQNVVKKVFRFKNCKPINYTLTALDNASGEPVRCTMTFIYIDMIPE
jgi:hypothetical protein